VTNTHNSFGEEDRLDTRNQSKARVAYPGYGRFLQCGWDIVFEGQPLESDGGREVLVYQDPPQAELDLQKWFMQRSVVGRHTGQENQT
jgi:hypothetical protein